MNLYTIRFKDSMSHSGTKGMKWGIRRWQNYDGSYTPAGRIHYGIGQGRESGDDEYGSTKSKIRKRLSIAGELKSYKKAQKNEAKVRKSLRKLVKSIDPNDLKKSDILESKWDDACKKMRAEAYRLLSSKMTDKFIDQAIKSVKDSSGKTRTITPKDLRKSYLSLDFVDDDEYVDEVQRYALREFRKARPKSTYARLCKEAEDTEKDLRGERTRIARKIVDEALSSMSSWRRDTLTPRVEANLDVTVRNMLYRDYIQRTAKSDSQ